MDGTGGDERGQKKDALNRVLYALPVALSMNTQFRKYRRALNKHRVEHTRGSTLDGTLLSFCPTLAPVRYDYDIS